MVLTFRNSLSALSDYSSQYVNNSYEWYILASLLTLCPAEVPIVDVYLVEPACRQN